MIKLCFYLTVWCSSFSVSANNIEIGSGKFLFEETARRPIEVYYYLPAKLKSDSKIIFVLPGAGRNGWNYRDAWIEASKKNSWIIISPSYSDEDYPRFWNYNLVNMIHDVKINASKTAIADFKTNRDSSTWLCNDFDSLFAFVKKELKLSTQKYEAFGHSAGGQILHRCVLSGYLIQANNIFASNAGWYTTTDITESFPYGLIEAPFSLNTIKKSFSKHLIVFLGEDDNEFETRGHLVRGDQLDKYGTHRLDRGKTFYEIGKQTAKNSESIFNWRLVINPNVGHDYKEMSKLAAQYLSKHPDQSADN